MSATPYLDRARLRAQQEGRPLDDLIREAREILSDLGEQGLIANQPIIYNALGFYLTNDAVFNLLESRNWSSLSAADVNHFQRVNQILDSQEKTKLYEYVLGYDDNYDYNLYGMAAAPVHPMEQIFDRMKAMHDNGQLQELQAYASALLNRLGATLIPRFAWLQQLQSPNEYDLTRALVQLIPYSKVLTRGNLPSYTHQQFKADDIPNLRRYLERLKDTEILRLIRYYPDVINRQSLIQFVDNFLLLAIGIFWTQGRNGEPDNNDLWVVLVTPDGHEVYQRLSTLTNTMHIAPNGSIVGDFTDEETGQVYPDESLIGLFHDVGSVIHQYPGAPIALPRFDGNKVMQAQAFEINYQNLRDQLGNDFETEDDTDNADDDWNLASEDGSSQRRQNVLSPTGSRIGSPFGSPAGSPLF
jgi:hypothetical protein